MKTLIIVDVQNDFLPGGALPVPEGHKIISVINDLQKSFDLILATKDWHPLNHISFAKTHGKKIGDVMEVQGTKQELWPIHCLQHSYGADFAQGLDTGRIEKVFYKGTDPLIDSYSTFFDNAHLRSTGLEKYLREKEVKEIYFAGFATDYCVKFSILDAIHLGFKAYVVSDACLGINLSPKDVELAIEEMKKEGALFITSKDVL